MRLERAGHGHRYDAVEFDAQMRARIFEHVGIAVRQDCQLIVHFLVNFNPPVPVLAADGAFLPDGRLVTLPAVPGSLLG